MWETKFMSTVQDFSNRVNVGDKIYVTRAGGTWDEVTDAVGIVTSITDGGAISGQVSVNMNWISGDVYYGLEDRHYDMSSEVIAILEDDNRIEIHMAEDQIPLTGTSVNYLVHGGDLSQFGDIVSSGMSGYYGTLDGSMFGLTVSDSGSYENVKNILSQYPKSDITFTPSYNRPTPISVPERDGCDGIIFSDSGNKISLVSSYSNAESGAGAYDNCPYLVVYNKYDSTNAVMFVDPSMYR